MSKTIRIAAALLIDPRGQTLLVRKRGTLAFMQPVCRSVADDLPVKALARGLFEEVGLRIDEDEAQYLGNFSAPAANEPGFEVVCELFRVQTDAAVVPAAEIEEAVWVDGDAALELELAPLTRDSILPIYRGA